MREKIKYSEGIFYIGYCENSQNISVYENGNYTKPIRVIFKPNIEMTERKLNN